MGVSLVVTLAQATPPFTFSVNPFTFDPFQTKLVSAEWMNGAGYPTNATINTGRPPIGSFTDPACDPAGGDPNDRDNKGLLVKTGPTANFASTGAVINGVKSEMIWGYPARHSWGRQI